MIELKGKYNKDCKIFLDEVEEGAIELVLTILNQEISKGVKVRIMPDTHVGKGIVIGFTMPMTMMVNPNYIGVDIGCSVSSYKLNRRFSTEELPEVDKAIRQAVPMGNNIHTSNNLNNAWVDNYLEVVNDKLENFVIEWNKRFNDNKIASNVDVDYLTNLCNKIGSNEKTFYNSVGSLGGGNHFIEIGESEKDASHYLTLHSGSRNFGLKICNYHANKMKKIEKLPSVYYQEFDAIIKNTSPKTEIPARLGELKKRYHLGVKEVFLQGNDMYDYLVDMVIAQTYAEFNHRAMSQAIFKALKNVYAVDQIYSMHNFIDTQDWIIRKGAIRAYEGEKMIIPFNMRDGLLICEGKSNADWNYSAPHGAGRILGRNQAMRTLDINQFENEMKGIYSNSVSKNTLDESPMAYKDKDIIINAIQDTAVILDTVKPILNIKAD